MRNWLTSPAHHDWLARHAGDLLAFGRRTPRSEGGAFWLDDDGRPEPERGVHTWITTRTVHVYGLGALLGVPGAATVAAAALEGLRGILHDDTNGGWYSSVGLDADGGIGEPAEGKSCYDHVFVVLAGATATHAGLDGGRELFDEAVGVLLDRFWDDDAGRLIDTWDTAFTEAEPYRGLNANMHGVEALLSAASLTGDPVWLERADRICRFVIDQGEANRWRLPEHYDADWNPVLDYNRDRPADQFKPYGATIGHAFEWARLLVHLANAPIDTDRARLTAAARELFAHAVDDGWAPDGAPGFVYTIDWDGTPVVRDRLWWVLTEAIGAAAALHHHTGDEAYADHYRRWWDHADLVHLDHDRGSWLHQLDAANRPDTTVWSGKPDLYHVFQAALIPALPLYPMIAAALDEE